MEGAPAAAEGAVARSDVEAAEVREVQGERLKLPRVESTMSDNKGAAPRQIYNVALGAGIPVPYAVDVSGVIVRHGELLLVEGKDYLFDEFYGQRRASARTMRSAWTIATRFCAWITVGRILSRVLPLLAQSGRDTMKMPDPGRKRRASLDALLTQTPELAVIVNSFEQRYH